MREEANFDETLEGKKSDNGGRPIGTMLLAAATMTSIFRVSEEARARLLFSLL